MFAWLLVCCVGLCLFRIGKARFQSTGLRPCFDFFEVSSEALEKVSAFALEVFQFSFFAGDLAVEAGEDIGFVDEDVVDVWGDFVVCGLGVDGGEFDFARVVVGEVTDGDGREVVEGVDGNDDTVVAGVRAAVGFDEHFDFVTDAVLRDLLGGAKVDFELGSVDFDNAGVGHVGG